MALPFTPLRQETQPNTPNIPGAAPPLPGVTTPQRPAVGESMAVNEQPEQEKHTVPPELPNALFHMAGRGGWNRISMSTVQSDDKRFTITHIDATRRNDWFLLKDLESGDQHEMRTMTEAKRKAKRLRENLNGFQHDDGSDDYSLAGEPVSDGQAPQVQVTPVNAVTHVGSYSNPLLKKNRI